MTRVAMWFPSVERSFHGSKVGYGLFNDASSARLGPLLDRVDFVGTVPCLYAHLAMGCPSVHILISLVEFSRVLDLFTFGALFRRHLS